MPQAACAVHTGPFLSPWCSMQCARINCSDREVPTLNGLSSFPLTSTLVTWEWTRGTAKQRLCCNSTDAPALTTVVGIEHLPRSLASAHLALERFLSVVRKDLCDSPPHVGLYFSGCQCHVVTVQELTSSGNMVVPCRR